MHLVRNMPLPMRGRLFLACGVLTTGKQQSSVTGSYRTRRLATDTYKQQPPGLSTTAEKQQRNHVCLLVPVTQRPKEELHKDPGSTSNTGELLSYSNMQAAVMTKGIPGNAMYASKEIQNLVIGESGEKLSSIIRFVCNSSPAHLFGLLDLH